MTWELNRIKSAFGDFEKPRRIPERAAAVTAALWNLAEILRCSARERVDCPSDKEDVEKLAEGIGRGSAAILPRAKILP